jgi:hypothetical protein
VVAKNRIQNVWRPKISRPKVAHQTIPRQDGAVAATDDPAELLARLQDVLRRLQLCSTTPGRAFIGAVRSSKPGSLPPSGGGPSPAEHYADEVEKANGDTEQLKAILRRADHELSEILRRPLAPTTTATLADLRVAIVDRGEGFKALEVAIALCTSEAVVRHARLLAGRDAERGRPLPLKHVNGKPVAFGLELVSAGFSLRAASQLSGVPRSTLHAHVARATDAIRSRA